MVDNIDELINKLPGLEIESHIKNVKKNNDGRYHCTVNDCTKSYSKSSGLKEHIKSIHGDSSKYKCDFEGCIVECSNKSNLTQHIKTHFNIKTYDCKFLNCDEKFTSNELLNDHRLVHLMCNICDKVFTRATKLKDHMKIHDSDAILYLCPIKDCGKKRNIKGFPSKDNMITHIQTYHKQFICRRCDMLFKSNDELLNHKCESD